jgi:hypothetical protein
MEEEGLVPAFLAKHVLHRLKASRPRCEIISYHCEPVRRQIQDNEWFSVDSQVLAVQQKALRSPDQLRANNSRTGSEF